MNQVEPLRSLDSPNYSKFGVLKFNEIIEEERDANTLISPRFINLIKSPVSSQVSSPFDSSIYSPLSYKSSHWDAKSDELLDINCLAQSMSKQMLGRLAMNKYNDTLCDDLKIEYDLLQLDELNNEHKYVRNILHKIEKKLKKNKKQILRISSSGEYSNLATEVNMYKLLHELDIYLRQLKKYNK